MTVSNVKRLEKTTIYIDQSDIDTDLPRFSNGKLLHIVTEVCKNYIGSFTVSNVEGGILYEDGNLTSQRKIAITFYHSDIAQVNEMAADLCAFFDKKSVVVEREPIAQYTVSNCID